MSPQIRAHDLSLQSTHSRPLPPPRSSSRAVLETPLKLITHHYGLKPHPYGPSAPTRSSNRSVRFAATDQVYIFSSEDAGWSVELTAASTAKKLGLVEERDNTLRSPPLTTTLMSLVSPAMDSAISSPCRENRGNVRRKEPCIREGENAEVRRVEVQSVVMSDHIRNGEQTFPGRQPCILLPKQVQRYECGGERRTPSHEAQGPPIRQVSPLQAANNHQSWQLGRKPTTEPQRRKAHTLRFCDHTVRTMIPTNCLENCACSLLHADLAGEVGKGAHPCPVCTEESLELKWSKVEEDFKRNAREQWRSASCSSSWNPKFEARPTRTTLLLARAHATAYEIQLENLRHVWRTRRDAEMSRLLHSNIHVGDTSLLGAYYE